MYTRISRTGGRAYLQLVQAYRDEQGRPRQRTVANLGRLDQLTEADLQPLIGGLKRALGQTHGLGAEPVFESARAFGDLFALQCLWNELGLGAALRRAVRSSRRQLDAEALVRLMVFNRLCDPASKLGVLRWLETVAMPGIPEHVSHDQLLRAMDALMEHAPAVDRAVAAQLRPLVDETLSVIFYDLTTVRIHGTGDVEADVRAFGLNKRTGGIARQFVLGVVQTAAGLPIAHQVHAGNTAEAATLVAMIEAVTREFPVQRVVLIADRGLLNLDNLAAIEGMQTARGKPLEYILAVPGRRYGEFAEVLAALTFTDGLGETQWQGRRLVVAHDAERAQAQKAARMKVLEAIEAEGERMAARLDAADEGQKLRGRKSSDRRAYVRFSQQVREARLTKVLSADLEADLFSFARNGAALRAMEQQDGKLLLVTNTQLPAAEVLAHYKSLADIERGFRVLKNDLAIGPVYHRLPERIRAHALICFLALVLYRILRMRLKASGSAASPRQALALLRQIQQHRVLAGEKTYTGTSRLRAAQRELFKELALPIP